MSVKVIIEMRVAGLDDPDLVEDALNGYWRDELDNALWQACKEAGLAVSDTEVLRVRLEAEESEVQIESNG